MQSQVITGRDRKIALGFFHPGGIQQSQFQRVCAEFRFNADLNLLVPANGTGWLKFQATEEQPLLGALFNKGPRFKGGRNLAAVSLLKKFALTVPTDPPQ